MNFNFKCSPTAKIKKKKEMHINKMKKEKRNPQKFRKDKLAKGRVKLHSKTLMYDFPKAKLQMKAQKR